MKDFDKGPLTEGRKIEKKSVKGTRRGEKEERVTMPPTSLPNTVDIKPHCPTAFRTDRAIPCEYFYSA